MQARAPCSIQNPAQEVVTAGYNPETDDRTKERKRRNLGPPNTVVRCEGDRGQPIAEHLRELIPDAGQDDVRARHRPDHVSDLFHTPRIAVRIAGHIGRRL
jgi:hypothetical protein